MLLSSACAPDGNFLFESTFDRFLSGAAINAHGLCVSTSALVVLHRLSGELEVALVAALGAGIGCDISWAEAASCAAYAHRVAFVFLSIAQHEFVETVRGELKATRIAAADI